MPYEKFTPVEAFGIVCITHFLHLQLKLLSFAEIMHVPLCKYALHSVLFTQKLKGEKEASYGLFKNYVDRSPL